MKYKNRLILIACVLSFLGLMNFTILKSKVYLKILNDSLYSEKVENFIKVNLENYQFNASAMENQNDFSKSLIGTKFDNFKFKDVNNHDIEISNINMPIVFENTASWCKPCNAIIPVLNQLSEKYKGKVKIILLTHDTQIAAKKFSLKFNQNIIVIPSVKGIDPNQMVKSISGTFKNIFPFPTSYFINSDKIIIDIISGGSESGSWEFNGKKVYVSKMKAFEVNYKRMNEPILKMLQK